MPRTSTETRIATAINLLAHLTSMPHGRADRSEALESLGVNDEQLNDALEIISSLADRTTGARAIVLEEGDDLVLMGDAAKLRPLRLTLEESLVLAHLLSSGHIDAAARERIEKALLPADMNIAEADAIADAVHYGEYYPALAEAIRYGIRCTMRYRSSQDAEPTERLIDPICLETEGGAAYLTAWDVRRAAQRRYRLDRISAVMFTDDSIEAHPWKRDTTAESLRANAKRARLRFPSEAVARQLGWAGMGPIRALPGDEGAVEAEVAYASEAWLFDQVLAGSGEVVILKPEELRQEFRRYAGELLGELG